MCSVPALEHLRLPHTTFADAIALVRHTSIPTLTWRDPGGPDHLWRWGMIGWCTSPGQPRQGPQCVSAAYRDTILRCSSGPQAKAQLRLSGPRANTR
jgi:hypothetical protein